MMISKVASVMIGGGGGWGGVREGGLQIQSNPVITVNNGVM